MQQMRSRRAQSSVRWLLLATILFAAGGAVAWAAWQVLRPVVTVTEVTRGPVVQAFYSTGTIEPEREYPIRSNTAGILTEVLVDKGAAVVKDQQLAVVTDSALVFTRDRAAAELTERLARADERTSPVLREYDARISALQAILEIANREQKRASDMLERDAASQQDLDRAIDRVKTTWSELESLKAQRAAKRLELDREAEVARSALSIAEWNLDQQTLRSPIDGVVLDRPTSIGTRVAVNDLIMRVADVAPQTLVMRAAVDEEDIVRVSIGQVVRLTLYALPGEILTGRVTQVYAEADPNRRTFEVDVRIEPPDERLQPGMTGELAFVLAAKADALIIPNQSIQSDAVWVVQNDRLVRRLPRIGITSVERAEVVSGLSSGERVVISPIGNLADGQHVRTRWMDPIDAAGLNTPAVEEQPFKAFD